MKKEKIQIRLSQPCSIDWNTMKEHGAQRHCLSCQKMVIDFTKLSDHEIIDKISQSSRKICGRFREKQLDATYSKIKNRNVNPNLSSVMTGLILLGTANCSSDTNASEFTIPIVQTINSGDSDVILTKNTDSLATEISGQVIDASDNEPIPFVRINLQGTKIGTVSDRDGYFKLQIPEEITSAVITIEFHYIGYQTTEHVINRKESNADLKLYLSPAERMLMGEVEIIRWE